jgi:hypothetical protein
MICTACGRQDAMAVFLGEVGATGGACAECVALADAMQDLWDVVHGHPAHFAAAVGHVMRVTIERNVP